MTKTKRKSKPKQPEPVKSTELLAREAVQAIRAALDKFPGLDTSRRMYVLWLTWFTEEQADANKLPLEAAAFITNAASKMTEAVLFAQLTGIAMPSAKPA